MSEPLSTTERRELDRWLDQALDLDGVALAALLKEVPDRLRGHLERLLGLEAGGSPLDLGLPRTLLEAVAEETSTELLPAGTRLGAWEIVALLGRGGMGEVYRARRADGAFDREVALKVATVRHRDDERRLRLESERRILAGLSHPAIAGLLDGGVTTGGRPWFAMELVEGEPLLEACDRRRMTVEQRLELFGHVAGAIEAAHRRAVVHRDLKPSNVLVTGDLEVKLLDFGIAGVLGADGAAAEATGWLSPDYASPEMLGGEPVGAPSDIFQLGILLYQLVIGVVPVEVGAGDRSQWLEQVGRAPAPEARWRALDPASRMALAAARGTSATELGRRLRGDLGAILARATAFEIEQRYETVGLMLDDIRRWRLGLPVRAVGDGLAYRAGRFFGRHRLAVLTSAAALMVAAAFVVATGLQLAEQERAARIEAERAGAVARFLADLFRAGDPLRRGGPEPRVRELLDRGAERLERELGASPEVRDSMRLVLGQAYLGLGETTAARPLLEQALTSRREQLGADDPALAEVWLGLAEVARIERRHDDAQAALESALRLVRDADLETRLGVERARLARDRGQHQEALELIAAVREGLQPGAASSLVYQVEAVEGSVYFDQGRHLDAARHLQRATDAARGEAAMEAQLATALGLLAGSELYLGRPVRARDALEEAVGLWDHTVGPQHPEALLARANLAAVYAEIGQSDRALELAARVESGAVEVGDRVALARAEVARGMAQLAQPGLAQGDRDAAVAAVTHGGAVLASRFGSAAVARIWADLGDQLWQAGEEEDALRWWHRAWQAADWPAGDTRRVDLGWREVRARLGLGDRPGAEQLLTQLEAEATGVVLEGTLAHTQVLVIRATLDRESGQALPADLSKRLAEGLEAVRRVDPRGAAMTSRHLVALGEVAAAR